MARSLPHPLTRRAIRRSTLLGLLLAACAQPAPVPMQWTVSELAAPRGFRAFGWGAGDTLWGIARGRLAMASLTGDSLVTRITAWNAGTAPGHDLAWWNAEDGVFVRRDGQPGRVMAATPPSAEHLGPDVLWSPDGARALLTWTAESGPIHTVIEADSQRILSARLTGYSLGAGATWLDSRRVVVTATAHGPRSGQAGHREGGYRGDLAVLDVASDRAMLVTAVADGDFLVPEGLLHPDTLLVGLRRSGNAVASVHHTLHTRAWTLTLRLERTGRAAAAHGLIALLEPAAGTGQPAWQFFLVTREGASGPLSRVQGYDVRLLWHPQNPMVAVAAESETAGGIRTIVVR
jgi:hypothetical protein